MDFLSKLLQGIAFVPTVVNGIEGLFGGKSGAQKKDAALSFLETALSMTDAVASRHIVDETKFREGINKVIDGTVECLNASAWKKSEPTPTAWTLLRKLSFWKLTDLFAPVFESLFHQSHELVCDRAVN